MKRSTRLPGPHRMPPATHWQRVPEPADVPAERPDVTTDAWVGWFERSLREVPEEPEPVVFVPPEPGPMSLPAPTPAPRVVSEPPRRLSRLLGVAAVVVLALLLGTWWWTGRGDPEPTPRARQVEAPSRGQAPPVPVALPVNGRHTEVRVLASGDLAVQEWLRRPSGSVVYDAYRLTGALERSGTRALARLEPVELGRSTDRTIDVVGGTVLALACTTPSQDVPVPCGADAGDQGWRLVGPAATSDAEVLVQLDLAGEQSG